MEQWADVIMANPPFGLAAPAGGVVSELCFLELCMDMLKPGGRLCVILPDGVLFRTERAFREARQRLLREFALIAVIRLPAGSFPTAPSVRTNVLHCVRDAAQPDRIRYYQVPAPAARSTQHRGLPADALQDALAWVYDGKPNQYSWEVQIEDVKRGDWSLDIPWPGAADALEHPLDPARYAGIQPGNAEQLLLLPEEGRDWCNAGAAEPLGRWIEERGARAGNASPDRFLGVSKNGIIPPQGRRAADTRRHRRLEIGDIAYNPMRAALGSFAICRAAAQEGWVSPAYVVFRLAVGAPFDAGYLLDFLKCEFGKVQIDQHSHGSVRRRLHYKDLEQILVPVPSELGAV